MHRLACILVLGVLHCSPGVLDLVGPWHARLGQHGSTKSPATSESIEPVAAALLSFEEWRPVKIPQRFRAAGEPVGRMEWVTLQRRLPAEIESRLAAGEPIAFQSGLISDVAIFYLNGRAFARLGSARPYESALYRRTLSYLPTVPPRTFNGELGWELRIELFAPQDRPLHLEGPEIQIGPAGIVARNFYYSELVFLCLIVGLAGISFFHVLLGVQLGSERHHFYYSLFALCWSIYMVFRIATRDVLFDDAVLSRVRLEYSALFLTGPTLILFLVELFERRTSRFGMVLGIVAIGFVGTIWALDYPRMRLLLRAFHAIALPTILVIGWIVYRGVRTGSPDAKPVAAGMLLFLLFALNDILSSMGVLSTPLIARYALPVMIVSTTVLLVRRMIRMYRQSLEWNSNLEETVLERTLRLRTAMRRAEAASKAKSEFLANMSHEIRTPMNAILGMADLLAEARLPEEESRYVHTLQSSGRNLLVLLNDILDVSRIEAGQMSRESIAFAPAEVFESVRAVFQVPAENKSLALNLQLGAGIPEQLIGDPHRLRQILTNLVGNAVKFTSAGKVELGVRVAPTPEFARERRSAASAPGSPSDTWLEIVVRDTGIGIPAEKLDHIFEQFSQSDSSITRQYGGTGLGLFISRSLVELLGGSIRIHSAPGEGTEFQLLLPFARPGSDDADPRPADGSAVARKPEPELAAQPFRLLLVDDTEENRMLFRAYLKRWAVEIDEAADGEAAVALFEQSLTGSTPYNIVFMDIQMPRMDGLSATRAIRGLERERNAVPVPVLALSAYAHEEEQGRSLSAGCNEHISKPFSKARLYEALGKYVRNSRQSGKPS